MATKSSDDPVDLGGFMQNFVLSNPFKDLPSKGKIDPDNLSPSKGLETISCASSPGGNHNNTGGSHNNTGGIHNNTGSNHSNTGAAPDSDASEESTDTVPEFVIKDRVGQVLDTPKAHFGSNVTYATALKQQKVSFTHAKVQQWLKDNYMYESTYIGTIDAKSLLTNITEKYPHISSIMLSKIMTFTFPDCPKVTNIHGCQGYRGLVAKPQPEDYCNIDLLKAVSHAKLYGSVMEAAKLYHVADNSVASLHYWHTDLGSLPVHVSVASQLGLSCDEHDEQDVLDKDDTSPETDTASSRAYNFRPKRRRSQIKDFCDPDTLSDVRDEDYTVKRRKPLKRGKGRGRGHDPNVHGSVPVKKEGQGRGHAQDKVLGLVTVKNEEQEANLVDAEEDELVGVKQLADKHGIAYSLLKNLLKNSHTKLPPESFCQTTEQENAEKLDTPLVIVKSEPVDAEYGDFGARSRDNMRKDSTDGTCKSEAEGYLAESTSDEPETLRTNVCVSSVDTSQSLYLQETLKRNQKLEVELLLSQEQVASLKSTLCTREVALAELMEDFTSLHAQFRNLTYKFKAALSNSEQESSKLEQKGKKLGARTGINGSLS